jgi:hypothetical protein
MIRSALRAWLVLAGLAAHGGSASAAGCLVPIPWFCEPAAPVVYAPMRVPVQDPRVGPVWTSNGWSYPQAAPDDEDVPPVWAREGPAEPRSVPGPERPLK